MALPSDTIPARFMEADEPDWWPEVEAELDAGAPLHVAAADDVTGPARWTITSRGQAEWAMRRLAELTGKAAAATGQAAEWRRPIDEWEAGELKRVQPGIDFFRGHLERYGRAEREAHPKEATVRLPSGNIATRRATAPVVTVDDEADVLAWADDALGATELLAVVKTEQTIRLRELRELLTVEAVSSGATEFCAECGTAIVEDETTGWGHEDEATAEYDHEALRGPAYRVVLTASGKEVPGVSAAMPATSVTVKPA